MLEEVRGAQGEPRRSLRVTLVGICVLSFGLAACGSGADATTTTAALSTTSTAPAPAFDCSRPSQLLEVSSLLDSAPDRCREWVDRSVGRAVQSTTGSAAIWSRRTGHGTALVVGAVHTLGEGWFGSAGTAIDATLVDPGAETGVLRLFLAPPGQASPDDLVSPLFRLYNPAIAAERNGNLMRDVLPREDFYVAVADSQKYDVSGLLYPVPEPIVLGEVPLHDPAAATLADPTHADAGADDLVLLLGFPNGTGALTAAIGRVLGDREAEQAVAALAEAGDPEGTVPYEPQIEMIIAGAAKAGMSGGPVVDRDGRLVGVLVRASDPLDGSQYVRAVRLTHIASELEAAFRALPADAQQAVAGYLERTD